VILTALGFLKTPVARWLGIALATFGLLMLVYNAVHTAGADAHARQVAPIIERLKTDLTTCQDNTDRLGEALEAQNDAVQALKAQSDAKIAEAAKTVSAAQKSTLAAEVAAARIRANPPRGSDVCVRMLDADETFLEALR